MEKVYIVCGLEVECDDPKIWGMSTSRSVAENVYLGARKKLSDEVSGDPRGPDFGEFSLEQVVWDGKGVEGFKPSDYEVQLPKGSHVIAISHAGRAFPHWVHIMLAEIPLIPERPAEKRRKIKK